MQILLVLNCRGLNVGWDGGMGVRRTISQLTGSTCLQCRQALPSRLLPRPQPDRSQFDSNANATEGTARREREANANAGKRKRASRTSWKREFSLEWSHKKIKTKRTEGVKLLSFNCFRRTRAIRNRGVVGCSLWRWHRVRSKLSVCGAIEAKRE